MYGDSNGIYGGQVSSYIDEIKIAFKILCLKKQYSVLATSVFQLTFSDKAFFSGSYS